MSPPGLTLLLKFSPPLTVNSSILGTKCISQSLPHVWNIIMLHTCLFHWIPVKFFLPCYFSYTPRATKVQIFVNGVLALKTTYVYHNNWELKSVVEVAPGAGLSGTVPLKVMSFPRKSSQLTSCGAEKSHPCRALQNVQIMDKVHILCLLLFETTKCWDGC